MDLIDKLLIEWSWRCKKGYPDLQSAEDLAILKEVFGIDLSEAKHPFEYLNADAQETAQELMDEFGISKEDIKAAAKNRIVVLSDIPRQEFFSKLSDLGYERDNTLSGSSAGGFKTDNGVEILHKPASSAAQGGAGVENENIFVDAINTYIKEHGPVDVELKGERNTVTYKKVTKVDHIGKEGEAKGWKGDARLITADGEKHLSIKKDGGYRWESVIKRYKSFYETFLTKAYNGEIKGVELRPLPENPRVLQMMNPTNDKPYGRIYITGHPQLEADTYNMAFGIDNADIVQRTFIPSDFSFENGKVVVRASRVLLASNGVDGFDDDELPIIEFERNASKASKTEGPFGRGIVMRTSPRKRVSKTGKANDLLLTYDQIMK